MSLSPVAGYLICFSLVTIGPRLKPATDPVKNVAVLFISKIVKIVAVRHPEKGMVTHTVKNGLEEDILRKETAAWVGETP